MRYTQEFQMNRLWHFAGIYTLSTNFPDRNASVLCHTTVIPLSYQIRNKYETNTNQIRIKFETNS